MLHALSAISVLLLSVSGIAKPIPRAANHAHLPISRKINAVNTAYHNALEIDQHRARLLRNQALNPAPSPNGGVPEHVTNAVVIYTASVGIGSPATQYDLIVDTGSSNTWIGAQASKTYIPTETSEPTTDAVVVVYGSGLFAGNEYNDQVTLAPGLVIDKQGVGVSRLALGFQSWDGILGVGPTGLTVGTLFPDRSQAVPTVVDNLVTQGDVEDAVLGVSFNPLSSDEPDGELSFGDFDNTKFVDELIFTPITATSPASHYWGIDITAVYGETTILPTTAGIVDTGTTLILLATDAFQAYQTATGAVPDSNTGLLKITAEQYEALETLVVVVDDHPFELTPNAQIWPRSYNAAIGGENGAIYLVVADLGQNSGSGLDFILGYTFLERFYSVYDTTNGRVGLASTPYTYTTTN